MGRPLYTARETVAEYQPTALLLTPTSVCSCRWLTTLLQEVFVTMRLHDDWEDRATTALRPRVQGFLVRWPNRSQHLL